MHTDTSRADRALATLFFALLSWSPLSAQCNTGGGGGPIPAAGSGSGVWPGTLPSSPLVATLNVAAPSAGSVLNTVRLNGFTHTWAGDVQVVLESPANPGVRHNILHRLGSTAGSFGCSGDFNGDYQFFDPVAGQSVCGGLGQMSCTSAIPGGNYVQDFGDWPSAPTISNTPIEQIPIASGTWTIYVYDWVNGDTGALTSFELCFGPPSAPGGPGGNPPPPPTCAGAASTGEGPHQQVTASPVTLSWTASPCADTRRSRVRRVSNPGAENWDTQGVPHTEWRTVTPTPITNLTTSAAYGLLAGEYEWQASSENQFGASTLNPTCTFCIPGRICLSPSFAGGSFPQAGALNGIWPNTLPTGALVSTAAITVPAGSTQLVAVQLQGLTHSRIGDLQLVLVDPIGGRHNLLQLNDGAGGGSCATAISGDYKVVDKVVGLITCSGYERSYLCGAFAPGEYFQHHGAWNSGDAGIFNTPLASIPVSSGNWSLEIYDWDVGANNGSLASWTLCFDVGAGPTTYCTAGTSSNGCVALISASAQPSASFASACNIAVSNLEGQKLGLLFYGLNNSGYSPVPWSPGGSSFLCVKPPIQRTPAQSSGGTAGLCDGFSSLDWNGFLLANPAAMGSPFTAGDSVFVQAWYRDPPSPKTTNLSAAVELTFAP